MNTNNKEAIELLEAIIAMTQKESAVIPDLARDAIKLLQDNEDTEVKEEPLLQNNPGHEHLPSGVGKGAYCVGCLERLDKPSAEVEEGFKFECRHPDCQPKPSSKVEKLKELRRTFRKRKDMGYEAAYLDLLELLAILIEDEE